MDDQQPITEAALNAMLVGDTLQLRVHKDDLDAEPRDRVAPVVRPPAGAGGQPTLERFTKSAAGEWEIEKVLAPKGATVVEILVRRIAS